MAQDLDRVAMFRSTNGVRRRFVDMHRDLLKNGRLPHPSFHGYRAFYTSSDPLFAPRLFAAGDGYLRDNFQCACHQRTHRT